MWLHRFMVFGVVFLSCFLTGFAARAQPQVSEEDAQEVLRAMAEADMVQEVTPSWQKSHMKRKSGGQWDARYSIYEPEGSLDSSYRLKIQSSRFSARGRWRKSRDGQKMQAITARAYLGSLQLQVGGLGMSSGYGLLISTPGRSGGLAAGLSLPLQKNRIKGWASSAEKRSALGVGFSWKPNGWQVMAMHGRVGDPDQGLEQSAVSVQKHQESFTYGAAIMETQGQRGVSLNGRWLNGRHLLGFEWVQWGQDNLQNRQGVWLVALKSDLGWGLTLEAQWAAANGSVGPASGVRPVVLDAWGGAGWAVRVSRGFMKSWRLKLLLAESRGHDWDGLHQIQSKQFVDILVMGRPQPHWNVSARWHQRMRSWDAFSESYPWLPPALVKQDERLGLTLDAKFAGASGTWVYSLRSLGRNGATSSGRRTLVSVRHRRSLAKNISLLLSFQTAWGAAVDLVTAISPIGGVLLPRHWGSWSSEILAGVDFSVLAIRLMVAVSHREPAAGQERLPEMGIWAGAKSLW